MLLVTVAPGITARVQIDVDRTDAVEPGNSSVTAATQCEQVMPVTEYVAVVVLIGSSKRKKRIIKIGRAWFGLETRRTK